MIHLSSQKLRESLCTRQHRSYHGICSYTLSVHFAKGFQPFLYGWSIWFENEPYPVISSCYRQTSLETLRPDNYINIPCNKGGTGLYKNRPFIVHKYLETSPRQHVLFLIRLVWITHSTYPDIPGSFSGDLF